VEVQKENSLCFARSSIFGILAAAPRKKRQLSRRGFFLSLILSDLLFKVITSLFQVLQRHGWFNLLQKV
jgi:hypothetical protein